MTSLCRTNRGSCGACCGLYNRVDRSRTALGEILERRTRLAAPAARAGDEAALRAYVEIEGFGGPERPFPFLPDCPLLGFVGVGDGERRVGCLVHPEATGGWDGRGLGAHEAAVCRDYLCPSHQLLSEKEIALAEVFVFTGKEGWYLYGLTITDPAFLKSLVELLEGRLCRPLPPGEIRAAAQEGLLIPLLSLKEGFPFADPEVFLGLAPRGAEDPVPYRPENPPGASPALGRLLASLGVRRGRSAEAAEFAGAAIDEAARRLG